MKIVVIVIEKTNVPSKVSFLFHKAPTKIRRENVFDKSRNETIGENAKSYYWSKNIR